MLLQSVRHDYYFPKHPVLSLGVLLGKFFIIGSWGNQKLEFLIRNRAVDDWKEICNSERTSQSLTLERIVLDNWQLFKSWLQVKKTSRERSSIRLAKGEHMDLSSTRSP